MADLQYAHACMRQLRDDDAFNVGTDVASQEHSDVALAELEDDGVVVADARPLPVRLGRMKHAQRGGSPLKDLARASHLGSRASCLGQLANRARRFVTWHF